MRKTLLSASLLLAALTTTVSCRLFDSENWSNMHTEAQISLPLGSITLTDSSLFALAGNFAKELHINEQTKVLYVNLSDSLMLINQESFNSIFTFGEQYFDFDISSGLELPPIDLPNQLFDLPEGIEQTLDLALPGGERLDAMVFASGNVRLSITNSGSKDFSKLKVTVPQIVNTKTGLPLVLSVNQNFSITKDYVIQPNQLAGSHNGFTFALSGKVPLVTNIKGRVTLTLNNLQSAKGFFGRKEVIAPTITLSVSEDFEKFVNMVEYLYFEDPKLVFNILNQYNAPMIVELSRLEISGQKLEFKPGYNSFFVPAKDKATFVLSNENSVNGKQLSQLIGTNFKSFVVNVNAVMNPNAADIAELKNPPVGYVEPEFNSFSMTDSLFGSYAVTIPFDAVIQNARFEQEIDLDLSSMLGGNIDVEQFAFGFAGSNSMPLDIAITAYIKDDQNKMPLFETPILIPASISKNEVNAIPSIIEGSQMLITEVKSDMLQKLFSSKKILFEFSASTKDALLRQSIKIFSPSAIKLDVLVGTKLDISLSSKGQAPKGKVVKLTN